MLLQDKIALVTGSSAGIGAAITRSFAAHGADVVVNYRSDADGAERTADAVRKLGRRALVVRADVSDADNVRDLFDRIKSEMGRLDILVNNAAAKTKKPFDATDERDWDRVLDTNLKSVFLCCSKAIALMPTDGSILNISSIHACKTTWNFSAYAASKGGMESLTRALAIELGERGIRVNALRLGWIAVEREPFGPDDPSYEAVCQRMPLRRVGHVDDVCPTAVHLCSQNAGFVTGQVVAIDGGAEVIQNTPYPKGNVEGGAWEE